MWITNGLKADWCCLLANTDDGPAHRNKSLIVLPMDAAGITKQKIHKIGMHSSDTAQLFFDNVRVPRRHLVGEEGKGRALLPHWTQQGAEGPRVRPRRAQHERGRHPRCVGATRCGP